MFQTKFNEHTKLWTGAHLPLLYNPNASIAQILLRSMKVFGSKIAQISDDTGTQLTFNDLRIKTIQAAQNLQKRGYEPKQVVGFMVKNSAYLSPVVFASFCLGCPVNVMDTTLEKPYIIKMLQKVKPTVMFCDVAVYDLLKECLNEVENKAKIFTFNEVRGDSEAVENLFVETGTEESYIPVKVDGINDIAAIMCTSGTSGAFKGVCMSHAMLISQITAFDVLSSDDILFNTSSLYWISGWTNLLLGTFYGATRIITAAPISIEKYLAIIETYRVSIVIFGSARIVPLLKSEAISKTNLDHVKYIFLGGAMIPIFVAKQLDSYLPNGSAINAYGCTEFAGIFAIDFPKFSGTDTSGHLFSGYSCKIVDDDNNRCGIGTAGEIRMKGPVEFLGYYQDPDLTKQVIDSEGFFLTGDIGRFDKDGKLYIVGRKKDLLGYPFYISPYEIEEDLLKSPDIESACVVGITYGETHELPAAVIVRAKNSQITEDDVYKMVADNMADRFKLRAGVYFVDSFPTTPSGKVIRLLVKKQATELFNIHRLSSNFKKQLDYKL